MDVESRKQAAEEASHADVLTYMSVDDNPHGEWVLTYMWFSCNSDACLALPKSIAESTKHQIAWENLQHLHKTLKEHNLPIPGELSDWANDVEIGKRQPPNWIARGAPPSGLLTNMWLSRRYSDADLALRTWIAASTKNWIASESLQHLLKTLREHNLPVPEALHEWAYGVADGSRRPPKRKRGGDGLHGFQNIFRDLFIVLSVKELQVYGIPATSNKILEVKDDQGLTKYEFYKKSACRIVGSWRGMSYVTVYKVWNASKWDELKEAWGLYSGDPAGFQAWAIKQSAYRKLIDQAKSDLLNLL